MRTSYWSNIAVFWHKNAEGEPATSPEHTDTAHIHTDVARIRATYENIRSDTQAITHVTENLRI